MSCISYDGKVIFHHIFKCGGQSITDWFYTSFGKIGAVYGGRPSSIEKVLYRVNGGSNLLKYFVDEFSLISGRSFEHPSPEELKAFLNRRNLHDSTIITVVRNPFDWHLSMYKYTRENWKHRNHRIVRNMSFDEYIQWVAKCFPNLTLESMMPEKPSNGNLIIGKLEELPEFIETIRNIYSFVDGQIPVINASKDKESYHKYYTESSRKTIECLNQIDLLRFKYEF